MKFTSIQSPSGKTYWGIIILIYVGLSIALKAQAPTITSPAAITLWSEYPYSQPSPAFEITGTNSPTWFTANNLPEGLQLNANTGVIFGYTEQTGSFSVYISAQNSSGATDATLAIDVIPNPLPQITSSYSMSIVAKQPYSQQEPAYTVTATNSPTWYSAAGLPTGIYINSNTGAIFGQCDNVGSYTVTIEIENSFGKSAYEIVLTVSPAPPEITSADEATVYKNINYTSDNPIYTVIATEEPVSFAATGLPPGTWMHGDDGYLFGTPTETGEYTVNLTAWNALGLAGEKAIQLTVEADPLPEISSALSATALSFTEYTLQSPIYTATATNAPSNITATGLPTGLYMDGETGTVFGQTELRGSFWVKVLFTNAFGTKSFWIELTLSAPTPIITSESSVSAIEGTVYTEEDPIYEITATENPSWFTATGLPDGLQINGDTGVIYGLTFEPGIHEVVLAAQGLDQNTGQAILQLTILEKGFSITSENTTTGGLGFDFDFQITASGSPIWWEAIDTLPPGLSLFSETGEISGIPTELGSFQFSYLVRDDVGREVEGTLTVTIEDQGGRHYLVTNTSASDEAEGSLPWALRQANLFSVGTPDIIEFSIPGTGPHTIQLSEELFLRETVTIDGRTQPGYNGTPLIHIDANGSNTAFNLFDGDDSLIAGLHITNFNSKAITTGVDADNAIIEDNWIGFREATPDWWRNMDQGGSQGKINYGDPYSIANGIVLVSSGNIIRNNVISGVHNGVAIGFDPENVPSGWYVCQNNRIEYNIIGLAPNGMEAIGNNSDGVFLGAGAQQTTILNNVLSANDSAGIEILHTTAINNMCGGNIIGLDIEGEHPHPNGEVGILVSFGASQNIIGGEYGPNIISANVIAGIVIGTPRAYFWGTNNTIEGNLIGTNADGTSIVQFSKPILLVERDIMISSQFMGIHIGGVRADDDELWTGELGYSEWNSSARPLTHSNTVLNNVIAGSHAWGIYLSDTDSNTVEGNWIGVNITDEEELINLGNGVDGLILDAANANSVQHNTIMFNGFGDSNDDEGQGIRFFNEATDNLVGDNTLSQNKNLPLFNAPEFSGSLTTTGKVGRELEFQLHASEDAIEFWSFDLPTGLSLEPSTGLISGIIWDEGTTNSTIYVKNIAGLSNEATLTFEVENALSEIIGSPYLVANSSEPLDFIINATESPNWMSIVTGYLPAGIYLYNNYPTTGQFSFRGTTFESGIYPIEIEITNDYFRSHTVGFTLYIDVEPPATEITADISYEVAAPDTWVNVLLWDWNLTEFVAQEWQNNPTILIFENLDEGVWFQPSVWLDTGGWHFRAYSQYGLIDSNHGLPGVSESNSLRLINPYDVEGVERATMTFNLEPSNEWCNVGLWDWSRNEWAATAWVYAPEEIIIEGLEHAVWYNVTVWGEDSDQWLMRAYAQSGIIDSTLD
jgi:parallel beta-helix repeat protein